MDTGHIEHDLFLLMLNLSQLKDQNKILNLYLEAINRIWDSVNLRLLRENEKTNFETIKIATTKNSFGTLCVEGNNEKISGNYYALIRNSASMLAVILENAMQDKLLASENVRLEAAVKAHTAKLIEANEILQLEIAERKIVENKLRQSQRFIESIVNTTPSIIYIYDLKEDRNVYINSGIQRILAYNPNEIQALGNGLLRKIIHPDDLEKIAAYHAGLTNSKDEDIFEIEYRIRHSNGEWRVFHCWEAIFLRNEKGQPKQIAGSAVDITDKIKAEEEKQKLEIQLRQSQKMESIGTLAGGIAHDFNNILFPIIGFTELSIDYVKENSKLRQNLVEVLKAALRAKDLVKQILAFSRHSTHELKPLKIQPLIKEVMKLLRATLPSTIEIVQHIDENCGQVMADHTQIHQVMMNLCINAYHAMMENGGVLKITLKNAENGFYDSASFIDFNSRSYLILSVSDTGHGMTQDIKERIFDPYFTTKEKGRGTGLGLAIVHGIIKNHSGDITVSSEPGKSSKFNIYLPIIENLSELSEINSDKTVLIGNESIMLIDDEAQIIQMEQQMLEKLGYKVRAYTSSLQALEAFKNNPNAFDLVITDQTMPHITGLKLAEKMIKIRPGIPIILCTGYSEAINEEELKKKGIREYAMKPILKNDISKVIRRALD